jgi:hypothetical protein
VKKIEQWSSGMSIRLNTGCGCLFAALTLFLVARPAMAAETESLGLYNLTIEIQMPHLDENLRYATARHAHCVDRRWLSSAFASLRYNALSDCALEHEHQQGDTVSYDLVCTSGHGTTGAATWRIGADRLFGRLNVTLGGKNMTFSEQISARRIGDCQEQQLGNGTGH